MNKSVTLTLAGLALSLGLTACGPQKYVGFEVWEGPNETSQAKKSLYYNAGGIYDQAWAMLENNDVDGAIKLFVEKENKSGFDWRYLAILYEVKHDWVKAEEAINKAIELDPKDADLQSELAYIQDHKARWVAK